MPPIVDPEERARSVQAFPAEKRFPRGFVAAVPTSPTPSTPLSPPALQPPPPSHYLRNRNPEGSDLIMKRSEIYTRVQRVLPAPSYAEDSTSGLLFGSDFHADWANKRLGQSTPSLSSPRCVVASPIHATHKPAAPLSAKPPSMTAHSNSISNESSIPPPRAHDEGDAEGVSPSMPASEAKERQSRKPFRRLLRERLTVKVATRSVEAAFSAQPSLLTDDLPRNHSIESCTSFSQQDTLTGPPSPGSSVSSSVYESSGWGSETDMDKKSVSSSAWQKGNPATPPSPFPSNLRTPPSAPVGLLEAQKVRRAKACDHFTRYSETMPFQFQRGVHINTNTIHAAPVTVLTLHSAREIPTEAPVQMQGSAAMELHRVSSAPDLKQHFQPQLPHPHQSQQPQSQSQQSQQVASASQQQSQSQAAPLYLPLTPPPQLLPVPPVPLASVPATEGRCPLKRPSVGSLKAILRPRAHSKAAVTGIH